MIKEDIHKALTGQHTNAVKILHSPRLQACTIEQLLAADLPAPKPIIPPFLFESDLCMIYGYRGSGKTWFSLGLSYSIAAGISFLSWKNHGARKVLFLDGEMRGARIKQRLAMIANAALPVEAIPDNLKILNRDMIPLEIGWPDMGTAEGIQIISALVDEETPEVIILDNISAWVRSGKGENDEESWRGISSFLMMQRAKGRAVIIIHHAGKNGAQRGTSKREDILDTVVALKKPDNYDTTEGLRVRLLFEKSRNLDGGEIPSIEVSLDTQEQKAVFHVVEAHDDPISKVHELIAMGATRREIMETLGVDRFQLGRLEKKAQAQGRSFILPDDRGNKKISSYKGGRVTV